MRHCLLIDDSPLIRKVARIALERLRYNVTEAETAEAAYAICEAEMPSVIVLDWHLPGAMTSLEFMARLRNLAGDKKPHVIYCTTEHDPLEVSKAMLAGCDDILIKPFLLADVQDKLATLDVAA